MWSEWWDSNPRLRAPKARRLAAGLHPDSKKVFVPSAGEPYNSNLGR